MTALRYAIVILVFVLAGALGGAVALVVAPRDGITTQGFATLTPTAGAATTATATAAADETPAPSAAPTSAPASSPSTAPATAVPTGSPTAAASPTAADTPAPTSPTATVTAVATATAAANSLTPAPGTIIEYTVQPGDLLGVIAARFNTTVAAIVALNPGINPNSLTVGQVLRIEVGEPEPTATPAA